jgi:hypothetical protein
MTCFALMARKTSFISSLAFFMHSRHEAEDVFLWETFDGS